MAKRSKHAAALRVPPSFRQERTDALHDVIRGAGVATLVTHDSTGLVASHVPVWLDAGTGPFGTLHGYLPRVDPQARPLGPPPDALMIVIAPDSIDGPMAIHAMGRLALYDDPERLVAAIGRLAGRMGRGGRRVCRSAREPAVSSASNCASPRWRARAKPGPVLRSRRSMRHAPRSASRRGADAGLFIIGRRSGLPQVRRWRRSGRSERTAPWCRSCCHRRY